jgi:hypothetical protein
MPSARRPRLPVRESRRELLPRELLNSVRERRLRQSRLSVCGGSIRSVSGKEGLNQGRLLFDVTGLAFLALCTVNKWYHEL